jgi:plastocyanin
VDARRVQGDRGVSGGRAATRRSMLLALALALPAALVLAVPAALGDPQLVAGPAAGYHDAYERTKLTINQGQIVSFENLDTDWHTVTAKANGPDRKPLFASPTTETAKTTTVNGTQYLRAGTYRFYCIFHTWMTGTLTVTTAGTPAVRPGQGRPRHRPPSHRRKRPPHKHKRQAHH